MLAPERRFNTDPDTDIYYLENPQLQSAYTTAREDAQNREGTSTQRPVHTHPAGNGKQDRAKEANKACASQRTEQNSKQEQRAPKLTEFVHACNLNNLEEILCSIGHKREQNSEKILKNNNSNSGKRALTMKCASKI